MGVDVAASPSPRPIDSHWLAFAATSGEHERMSRRFERYGPWALVAQAADSLGAAAARALAEDGFSLLLADRNELRLHALVSELSQRVEVRPILVDLAQPSFLREVRAQSDERDVGLVIINTPLCPAGAFLDVDVSEHQALIDLHCRAPLLIAHHFGERFRERLKKQERRGGLCLMSSVVGELGGAGHSAYAATRAFDLVLGEALWDELREAGTDVVVCTAGEPERDEEGALEVPNSDAVVKAAMDGLGRGPVVVPGITNRVTTEVLRRVFPRGMAVRILGRAARSRRGTSKPELGDDLTEPEQASTGEDEAPEQAE